MNRPAIGANTFLLCTSAQWGTMLLTGLLAAGAGWPWYGQISGWIGVAVFLLMAVFVHLVFTSGQIVALPHIAIFIGGLQYVLAAWLSFYYPPTDPTYDIGARMREYLEYASFVIVAVVLGWAVALWGVRQAPVRVTSASPALLAELDGLFWFGLFCQLVGRFVGLGGLGFVLLLCANLRYVGALGRMLVAGPGWLWRVLLTLILESLLATHSGMFHSLLLWCSGVFALCLYQYRPNKVTVISLFLLGFLLLPAFQQAKYNIRGKVWDTDSESSVSALAGAANLLNAAEWFKDLGDGLLKSVTWSWDADFLGDTGARYNQGWIVNRIMENVPSTEPFARGETLITAAKAAILPRFLAPNKHIAGGQEYMDRFARMNLTGTGTSMNLGYAGEMYVNFGYWGGIAGCFGYALALGLVYRLASLLAATRPLWWVFVLYVGLFALKAEDGIAEVLNWLVKASFVTGVIYFTFPALRATLSGSGNPSELNAEPGPSARPAAYRRLRAESTRAQLEAESDRPPKSLPSTEAAPAGPPFTFNHINDPQFQRQRRVPKRPRRKPRNTGQTTDH